MPTARPLARADGFTLVEMLVALLIFGLISAAGVTLLRSSADGQIQLRTKLGERATLSRLSNLLEADLAQAVPRSVRRSGGAIDAAFAASDGQLFSFSRVGAVSADDAGQSSLGRVSYRLAAGQLLRGSIAHADGGQISEAVILSNVANVSVRFRDATGLWRTDWSALDPESMPRAVEMQITPVGAPAYKMLFLVGADGLSKPVEPEEQSGV